MITAAPAPISHLDGRLNTRYIWTICLVAALGGLLFGYDWVVIGGAAKFYEALFQLKDTAQAVAADAGFWANSRPTPSRRSVGRRAARCWDACSARWPPGLSATGSAANRFLSWRR